MKSSSPLIPWNFLDDSVADSPKASILPPNKSFAQAVKNSCDIAVSQLPQPCLKGDAIAIKIPEADYQAGLQRCKNHLHGRLILSKGDVPIKFVDLRNKLTSLWSMIGKWSMIALGKGFFEFSFDSVEDMRSVCAIGSWSLKPGFLRLFLCSQDFNPSVQRLSHSQCWVKTLGLPQEYWSPRIFFSIAGEIGIPIALDAATNNQSFGHFAKVLVDINLKAKLPDQILVEREGYAFFVSIEYENLPEFCFSCQSIGHLAYNCRKASKMEVAEELRKKQSVEKVIEKVANPVKEAEIFINLDIEKVANLQSQNPGLDERVGQIQGILAKDKTPQIELSPESSNEELSSESSNEELGLTRVENSFTTDLSNNPQLENVNFVVQSAEEMVNQKAARDLRIVGRLWANEEVEAVEEEVEEEGSFTTVLSKSLKKRHKKKSVEDRVHFTRKGGYLQSAQ